MAARMFLRQRAAPVATGALIAGIALFPKTSLQAEAPDSRKPIYDDFESTPTPPTPTLPSSEPTRTPTKSTSPTPTDRLAVQIGKTRLFLQAHVAAAEEKVNQFMDSALHLEESFTSTIASLAPSPQSGEKLMPGSLYVLVAAMTGSIVSRNRNIFLRATVPVAVGIGAGWVVLPVTMRNVSDLIWKYEQRFPAVADGHVRAREGVERAWRMARIHTQQVVNVVDEKVGAARGGVEDWVKKGK
ncbi:mitochondrial protein-like protein [Mollisia scopiformis]|uniref:MICOS complex subunit n=1 Tax=Mollisia scopiformis TaxID=149040 RepID=A0A194XEI1_MOLSC|nr:mitochondrial protein-like protein [Mollisia scopiformis]KUJ18554.1 mitochondrial protein-like protein [Mollisia scopiformis]